VEDIASLPMLALWQGMNAHPWQGPPPVDGKGFLSVLFEATANPNLDPAAQTAYFTKKIIFLSPAIIAVCIPALASILFRSRRAFRSALARTI
jgi:hypothetical protein